MQLTPAAVRVLEARILRRGHRRTERPADAVARVVRAVARAEDDRTRWERRYADLMEVFLPNSPTLMNAGTRIGQLAACFVLPLEDSLDAIFQTVSRSARIHKTGGGTGYSFSRIRPATDRVGSTGGRASGPMAFLQVLDVACAAVRQGGRRRGANMGVLDISHPDIRQFIACKTRPGAVENFNLSVGVPDAFMEALDRGATWELRNPRDGSTWDEVDPRQLWESIVRAAYAAGDPGLLFLDAINRGNPTPQLGRIEATNPCGEQPLLPNEACTLGSLVLPSFVEKRELDWDRLGAAVEDAVRFLDDVVTVTRPPDRTIRAAVSRTRKIGLGLMGFADALVLARVSYGGADAVRWADRVMSFIDQRALDASEGLAGERGAYPAHEKGPAARNAARTSIAPTGTLSILANTTPSIEPPYALYYTRRALDGEVLEMEHPLLEPVAREEGLWTDAVADRVRRSGTLAGTGVPDWFHDLFLTAHEVTVDQHVRIQAAFQAHTDAGVSKTINLPNHATMRDVDHAYRLAHAFGCKGITVFRDGSKPEQVLDCHGGVCPV